MQHPILALILLWKHLSRCAVDLATPLSVQADEDASRSRSSMRPVIYDHFFLSTSNDAISPMIIFVVFNDHHLFKDCKVCKH